MYVLQYILNKKINNINKSYVDTLGHFNFFDSVHEEKPMEDWSLVVIFLNAIKILLLLLLLKIIEIIVYQSHNNKNEQLTRPGRALETYLWVTLSDFTVKTQIWKGKSVFNWKSIK